MPVVVGSLMDFGLDSLDGHAPRLVFVPSGPGVSGLNILASRPVEVIPESNGYFDVDLVSTDDVAPAMHYTVLVTWTDLAPRKSKAETLPWKLYVPTAGGALADLLKVPSNPGAAWVGTEPPENPTPGTWWLNPDTGDLNEWSA